MFLEERISRSHGFSTFVGSGRFGLGDRVEGVFATIKVRIEQSESNPGFGRGFRFGFSRHIRSNESLFGGHVIGDDALQIHRIRSMADV